MTLSMCIHFSQMVINRPPEVDMTTSTNTIIKYPDYALLNRRKIIFSLFRKNQMKNMTWENKPVALIRTSVYFFYLWWLYYWRQSNPVCNVSVPVLWCCGVVMWCCVAVVLWCCGVVMRSGAVVVWCCSLVLGCGARCCGATVLWCCCVVVLE